MNIGQETMCFVEMWDVETSLKLQNKLLDMGQILIILNCPRCLAGRISSRHTSSSSKKSQKDAIVCAQRPKHCMINDVFGYQTIALVMHIYFKTCTYFQFHYIYAMEFNTKFSEGECFGRQHTSYFCFVLPFH